MARARRILCGAFHALAECAGFLADRCLRGAGLGLIEHVIATLSIPTLRIFALAFALQSLVACNRTGAVFDGAFDPLSKR